MNLEMIESWRLQSRDYNPAQEIRGLRAPASAALRRTSGYKTSPNHLPNCAPPQAPLASGLSRLLSRPVAA